MGGTNLRAKSGTYDVLVLDASYRQSLVVVRSLGRAGLRIAIGESNTYIIPGYDLPAFRSRYTARRIVLPDIADAEAFASAVLDFAATHSVRVVIPAGDSTIATLRPKRQQFAEFGCTLALAPEEALEIANDKTLTLDAAGRLGIAYPESIPVSGADDLIDAAAKLGFPFVLKPTVSWPDNIAERVAPEAVSDKDEAIAVTERLLAAGTGILAQRLARGRREGVTLFIADGEVKAAMAHAAYRTVPLLGGVSVMRQSISPPEDILTASTRLTLEIGLEGLCEVEFRRDSANRPLLMEVNARPAGNLGLAVACGIDFPLMVWQQATGAQIRRVDGYRTGVRLRWLQGEFRWLLENNASAGRPDSVPRLRALWTVGGDFARTGHYDSVDARDIGPTITKLRNAAVAVRRKF